MGEINGTEVSVKTMFVLNHISAFVEALANVGTQSQKTDFKKASNQDPRTVRPSWRRKRTNITFPVHSGEHRSSQPSALYHVGLGVF